MAWRLRVRHTTGYEYEGGVHASYNEARLTPLDTVDPARARAPGRGVARPRTCSATATTGARRVHAFDLHHEHRELVVTGTSVVETAERRPDPDAVGRLGRRSTRRASPTGSSSTSRRRRSPRPTTAVLAAGGGAPGRVRHRPRRCSALGDVAARAHRVRAGLDERLDDRGPRSLRSGPGRVPGLRAPRARGPARRGHPGPVRVGLPVPGGGRRRRRDHTRARATRGSRPGSATGSRSTRRAATRRRRAPRARRARARLRRRRAAEGRVPRRPEPEPERHRRAHPR